MNLLLLSIGFGLVTASVLALAAVGVTLQFGVTNYINFAFGDFLTLGAYLAWMPNTILGLNIWASLIVGALGVGLFAVVINIVLLRPFIKRGVPLVFMLLVTFALSLLMVSGMLAIWGAQLQKFQMPSESNIQLGPFQMTQSQLGIIVLAIVVMLAVHLMLTRTKLGKAMRAVSDNPDLALGSGIEIDRISTITWFVSGCLAGGAGVVLAINITSFQPAMGVDFLFVIFAAVILGGIGSPYGAMLGAFCIGMLTEVSAVVVGGQYKTSVAFAVLVLVLLLRPKGLIASVGKTG
jgi:branched-subunit amino acid ABC-type transport system permease component